MNLGLVLDLTDADLTQLLVHRPIELWIPLARLTYNFIQCQPTFRQSSVADSPQITKNLPGTLPLVT